MTTKSIGRAVFGFGVLLIGLLTVIFAAEEAHAGADQSATPVENFQPLVETLLTLLPLLLFVVAAFVIIAFATYLKGAKPGGVGR